MNIMKNYISKLRSYSQQLKTPFWEVHGYAEKKVSTYCKRDEDNGKFVDYVYPVKQYKRFLTAADYYINRKVENGK